MRRLIIEHSSRRKKKKKKVSEVQKVKGKGADRAGRGGGQVRSYCTECCIQPVSTTGGFCVVAFCPFGLPTG